MANAALESAPIYLPVVQEDPSGRFFFTPQWLQWFLQTREQINVSTNSLAVHLWSRVTAPVTLSIVDQTLVTVSFTANLLTPPTYLFLRGVVNLTEAAGGPVTFENCTFTLAHGASVLATVTASSVGNEKTVVSFEAYDTTTFVAGATYTLNLLGRCLGTPAAIFPVVSIASLSALGTNI